MCRSVGRGERGISSLPSLWMTLHSSKGARARLFRSTHRRTVPSQRRTATSVLSFSCKAVKYAHVLASSPTVRKCRRCSSYPAPCFHHVANVRSVMAGVARKYAHIARYGGTVLRVAVEFSRCILVWSGVSLRAPCVDSYRHDFNDIRHGGRWFSKSCALKRSAACVVAPLTSVPRGSQTRRPPVVRSVGPSPVHDACGSTGNAVWVQPAVQRADLSHSSQVEHP